MAEAFASVDTDNSQAPSSANAGLNGPAMALLPRDTAHRGELRLLAEPLTALFCSQRCPGDLILQAYDLAKALRQAGRR